MAKKNGRLFSVLKSRRGVGMELAIIMLIIFTAFAMLIANVALLQGEVGKNASEREAQKIELDAIGEEFVRLARDNKNRDVALEALEQNGAYAYVIDEDMTSLEVKDDGTTVLSVMLAKTGTEIKITEWTR